MSSDELKRTLQDFSNPSNGNLKFPKDPLTGKNTFSLEATINSLRAQGIAVPQNQNKDSKQEVIDALEVKAVGRGLRRAIINMKRDTEQMDTNSFNAAKGLNRNDIDKNNEYLDFTELILWAQANAAQTKPFVKAEVDVLNKELKDAKLT